MQVSRTPGKSIAAKTVRLAAAYQEYTRLPMPEVDQNHLHDKSKYELEERAIRGQISMLARKYGLTFKELDNCIEDMAKLL